MQTTLRIDDNLYRDVKAKAALEGMTVTRFLEEGLRMRLRDSPKTPDSIPDFRVYGEHTPGSQWKEVLRVAEEAQLEYDLEKIGGSNQS